MNSSSVKNSSSSGESDNPKETQHDFIMSIIKETGLNTTLDVTRDNIKDVWNKVLLGLYPEEYPLYEKTFKNLVEKYVEEFPEAAVPRKDLTKYFTEEHMSKFLLEAKKSHAKRFLDYMRKGFDMMKSLWDAVCHPHEETFVEKVKRVIVENTPDIIKNAIKTDV